MGVLVGTNFRKTVEDESKAWGSDPGAVFGLRGVRLGFGGSGWRVLKFRVFCVFLCSALLFLFFVFWVLGLIQFRFSTAEGSDIGVRIVADRFGV